MTDIKKVNKNYYHIVARPTCSVFLDEYLMKKANRILYKYKNEMESLLQNNPEHLIEEHWSLAYPNKKQESFYGTTLKPASQNLVPSFTTNKVKNLYYIGELNIYGKKVKKAVKELMEKEIK